MTACASGSSYLFRHGRVLGTMWRLLLSHAKFSLVQSHGPSTEEMNRGLTSACYPSVQRPDAAVDLGNIFLLHNLIFPVLLLTSSLDSLLLGQKHLLDVRCNWSYDWDITEDRPSLSRIRLAGFAGSYRAALELWEGPGFAMTILYGIKPDHS